MALPQTEFQPAWQQDEPSSVESRIDSQIDYHGAWKAYALRRNLALLLLYSWLPVSFGLYYYSGNYGHYPVATLLAITAWLAAALAAVWWAGEFRCPRCRRRYGALGHRKGDVNMTRGIFDKVCANCKLTKFEIG